MDNITRYKLLAAESKGCEDILLERYIREAQKENRKSRLYRLNERIFQILGWGILPSTQREAMRRFEEDKRVFEWARSKINQTLFNAQMANLE